MHNLFDDLNPPQRRLMGPGPVDADPRVLNAMSMPLLGQFDPAFTSYMNEVMVLYRQLLRTENRWTFLIDGTARAGIEAALVSLISPGDRVLVPIFGRFGHLAAEIATRCGADVRTIEVEWGRVFEPSQVIAAIREHRPQIVSVVHGDTSTTMAQPLAEIGAACREEDVLLHVDATATISGIDMRVDEWQIDVLTAGLQKCLSGPPGCAPITFNERVEARVLERKHIEQGIRPAGFEAATGMIIASNYFDLTMLMDYWSESRLNHHTEATSMLYAARECARIALQEGLEERFARHARASRAVCAGLDAMGLVRFGDQAHKMANVTGVEIPSGVTGDAVRSMMLEDFGIEIGTSFGPLAGRIWRIGTMGYACRKENVMVCLMALEAALCAHGYRPPPGEGVAAALSAWNEPDA
ncbi:pyridoxal-phosphate-dependent aminotransferase family protein [Thioalkalivibrio sp. HK1]|uniref:pyridoxal-phosphate-dependent aminotransferase family protein n=1 Tax=Thioalkalivibrio sp. HK1 TaxID=1469245 RepID=UPI000470FD70|nr:alanine--glyoxylate aminotransferase family protein [Thioalkalivibrio sp. HK1]